MNLFDRINATIEGAEGSIITLVTTLIPWLAPALPAWLTYSHLSGALLIPWPVAATMALVVEFLGLSAISTAFDAMRHNRQKENRAGARRVLLAFPVGAYVFYILVILATNVILEWPMSPDARQYARIGVIALLTLISAPAFIIAVVRQEQRKIASDRPEHKAEQVPPKTEHAPAPVLNRDAAAELLRGNPSLTGAELARILKVSDGMGRRYRREIIGTNEPLPENGTNGKGHP